MRVQMLITRLQSDADESLTDTAIDWMKRSEDDELIEEVFNAAITRSKKDRFIELMDAWLATNVRAASSLLVPFIKQSSAERVTTLLLLGEKLVRSNSNCYEGAYLGSQLIQYFKQHQLLPAVQAWLDKNGGDVISGPIIQNLLVAHPSEPMISQALFWYRKNGDSPYRVIILRSLLEVAPDPELVREAVHMFSSMQDDESQLFLLAGALASNGETEDCVKVWIAEHPEHFCTGEILYEAFRANPNGFIDTVRSWLTSYDDHSVPYLRREAQAWIKGNKTGPDIGV